jgi:hypothetical protein
MTNRLLKLENYERDDSPEIVWQAAAAIRECLAEYYLSDKPFIADRMRDALLRNGFELPNYENRKINP